jgi:tetratricopeptide (TPR) repeat protein
MAEVPFSEEEFAAAELQVENALYNAGVIYNEKINDVDNAIEMFDELVQRFSESEYLITAYYQLYRLYVKKEVEGNYFGAGYRDNSEYYKDIILTDFPYSEYAKIIRNPNYLKEAELTIKKKEEDYIATYRNYKSHRYNMVLDECNKVINEDSENPFLAKYYFMKAMVVGSLSNAENFERELQLLADNFPQTEEGEKAAEILGQLNKKGLKDPKKGKTASTKKPTDKPKTKFEINESAEHFFAIIYPNEKGNVNKVKIAISNFNKKYYSNDKLKVTNSFINQDNQIVIVRRFANAERAMSYYTNFIDDDVQLKKVNDEKFTIFLISSKNFTKLFKSKDIEGYNLFFQENYL